MKSLAWFVGLLVLFLGLLGLSLSGDTGLAHVVGERVLSHNDDGRGYFDGALVFRREAMPRLTLEQLPTLEGRRVGSSYSGGFVTTRMSWFGVSLRDILARCSDLPQSRVLGDESLDELFFDVDAARPVSLLENSFDGWEPAQEILLDEALAAYGLQLSFEERPVPVRVLEAGPGWPPLPPEGAETGGDATVQQWHEGVLLRNAPVVHLIGRLRHELGFAETTGVDEDERMTLELRWDDDLDGDLERVLAEEFDLHLVSRELVRRVALVDGVATPPAHVRDELTAR